MELYCTRSGCPRPVNSFAELDDLTVLKRVSQKYCTACGMPLILRDRYLPGKLLGKGGFGVAVLARDRDTPTMRSCVVKVFRPPENLAPNQLRKAQILFEREAEVLEQLGNEHPQIPELYAFFELSVLNRISGKEDQFFYLVQEFINGQTLDEEQKRKGNFLEDEVEEILREILHVLQFVHEKGTIHRDIKPSNIMRDRQGRLYLLDFGAVKQVTSVPLSGISHKSTGIIYTPGYAPPEQMSGSQVYPATDLYALAVTCLTLLTGKSPQELYDSYSSEWRWRNYVQVSDRLASILDRMLLPIPQQRFPSAAEVLAALNNEFTSAPIQPQVINSVPQLPPNPPTISQSAPPLVPSSPQPRFTLWEVLVGAAFTGFEGGLLLLCLRYLPISPGISIGLWVMILAGLIFAQNRRIIEKFDLLIIAGLTLALVWFLLRSYSIGFIIGVPIVVGLVAIAITTLFRLIYKLIYRNF
ncbi:protein kinase domain-containing protein [Floridanema evergladense]|uniref:non-specific serine/threonine protein kinase n=1 Tax=Floridaenema evergladense BLCC-F167 TaxID=3153639 RepID=A0ABV4WWW5_9CYAN